MTAQEVREETQEGHEGASQALSLPDPAAALRNAARLWAEQNTRPETLARAEKLRDKVTAVISFFDFCGKHPGEVTAEDVSRWRAEMERRGLKPATVYARVSRVSAFYRWLMADAQLSRFILSNPAAQARPRHPRPYQSEATKALTESSSTGARAGSSPPARSATRRPWRRSTTTWRLRAGKTSWARSGLCGRATTGPVNRVPLSPPAPSSRT
jgi:hypothetical protein